MTHLIAWAAIAAAAMLPGVSHAQGVAANTAKQVHLRAGPARDYPIVAILPAGFPITVEGCLQQYTWCDVIAGGSRGWVYAGNITYYYQGQWVAVPNYAPLIGIGVLSFILDDYWSHHYYDRPWYAQRHRWANHVPPPPPRYRPPVPRGGVMPPPPAVRPPRVAPAVPLQPRPPGPVAPGTPLPGVRPAPQPRAPRPAAMAPAQQQRQLRQEQRAQQRHEGQARRAERDARRDNR